MKSSVLRATLKRNDTEKTGLFPVTEGVTQTAIQPREESVVTGGDGESTDEEEQQQKKPVHFFNGD